MVTISKKDALIYEKTKKYLESIQDKEIDSKMKTISRVLDISDKKKRLEYLYDLICDYLDNDFRMKNICDFDCGICVRRRDMIKSGIKKEKYLNGCCYSYKLDANCIYFKEDSSCSIKNIACKLYTCNYLKKRGYSYKLKDIYLARYFFNNRQKFYIESTFFVPKDVIIEGILKRG